MAKVVKKTGKESKKVAFLSPFHIYWEKTNYYLLGLGMVLVVLGFYFMSIRPWDSTPALVFSPIVLFIAFCVVLPAAIFYRPKKQSAEEKQQ